MENSTMTSSKSQKNERLEQGMSGPLRVLHVVEHWRPCTTGYATRSWELITAQARTEGLCSAVLVSSRQSIRGDKSVEVPEMLDGRLEQISPSPRERWLRPFRANTLDSEHHQTAIQETARNHDADVIHVHWSSGLGLAAVRAAESFGCPVVAEVRFDLAGVVMTETVRMSIPFLESGLRRYFERHLPRADAVVAASHSLQGLSTGSVPNKQRPCVNPLVPQPPGGGQKVVEPLVAEHVARRPHDESLLQP